MAAQDSFTGMITLTIIEATGLKPTTLPGGKILSVMDPYTVVDFDDIYFGKTSAKAKTSNPVWGEPIDESVEDAQRMQLIIFHKSTIPPDPFIAHVQVDVGEMLDLYQQGHEEHEVFIMVQRDGFCCCAWPGRGACLFPELHAVCFVI